MLGRTLVVGFSSGLLAVVGMMLAQDAPVKQPAEIFVAANSTYDDGDYPSAIALYLELVDSGLDDGHIHFNLGNAYLRNGELGRAVASFRRSQELLPRDENIEANLSFARQSSRDAIAPPRPSPVLSALFFWHYKLSVREMTWFLLVTNLLFWGLAIWRLFRRHSELLRWLSIALLAGLLAIASSLVVHRLASRSVAVVLPQEIDVRTAPDEESVVRFKLHAGTEVRLEDTNRDWLRIELPDGQQGWIEAEWAEIV